MTIALKKTAAIAIAAGLTFAGSAGIAAQDAMAQENGPAVAKSTIDVAKKGSITLYKKADPESLGTPTGEEDTTVKGENLKDAGFTLYPVTNADLTTNAGLVAASKLTAGSAKLGTPFAEVKTDKDGKIVWSDLKVGVYLVKETSPVAGYSPAADFLVFVPMTKANAQAGGTEWMYDVVAYPKNYKQKEPKKSVVDSGKNVSQQVEYTIDTWAQTIDTDRQKRTIYRIEDTLDPKASTTEKDVQVLGNDFEPSDYKIKVEGQKVVVTFTEASVAKIKNGQQISVKITAKVNEMPANGILKNTAVQIENNPNNVQEEKKKPTNDVETRYAGIQFKKVSKERKPLEGAEFQVYGATDGQDCKAAVTNDKALQTTEGKSTFVSGQDGMVKIDGLHVNDGANNDPNTKNQWTKYCLVETKSPKGFELLSQPIEFTLLWKNAGTLQNIKVGDNDGEVVNLEDTTPFLPNTGGMGIAILILAGLGIIGGGAYVARRNSQAA
ncbi:SpaH/EbpB family LPXTG-anchored major pilin [Corynebacterium sp. UMB10119B.1]|uniref:SpaH/EbpB family LPXTG-anchored major pilin n=1 Tax=Corynebacterium sp. UMB10119B.1 TaxID=3050601 RepID=UPI00254ACEE7|nr:SpaH/EbpB family LPXTG-anchored major pilin [Corynebacterium sp. UMB10119B]MDK8363951.1 SpaH/EbpB family LPXTG-anchored major pilin [Corynebacterium sp. UMB10119B]